MTEENNNSNNTKVSFIIDGVVADSMMTDNRWAAIFLSEPIMIETTGLDIRPGDIYKSETGKFIRPEQVIPAFDIN
jgi:hypothetical protein